MESAGATETFVHFYWDMGSYTPEESYLRNHLLENLSPTLKLVSVFLFYNSVSTQNDDER